MNLIVTALAVLTASVLADPQTLTIAIGTGSGTSISPASVTGNVGDSIVFANQGLGVKSVYQESGTGACQPIGKAIFGGAAGIFPQSATSPVTLGSDGVYHFYVTSVMGECTEGTITVQKPSPPPSPSASPNDTETHNNNTSANTTTMTGPSVSAGNKNATMSATTVLKSLQQSGGPNAVTASTGVASPQPNNNIGAGLAGGSPVPKASFSGAKGVVSRGCLAAAVLVAVFTV
ncbi:hypothetical protein BC830DRAFT_1166209 [Chytriomyces sp. MP71]|nr:hypothetical protein BC830DRAFT_1166209 [Chytriomyces sp. MP71]